jgi:predicted outer membrane repeat protein
MDRTPRERSTRRRMSAILATLGLVAGTLAVLAPAAAAATPPCWVKNTATGIRYTGTGPNLQRAINRADPGVTLLVRGRCVGVFVISINADLSLRGSTSKTYPKKATLNANGAGTVLTVTPSAVVKIRGVNVIGGAASLDGGGIYNAGTLTLGSGATVRGNTASDDGGGVYNYTGSSLTLNGSSSVQGNKGGYGGGILSDPGSTVTLNGSSSVRGNRATHYGGGIYNGGTVTLNGSSSVRGNKANTDGGGIANGGTVTLNDSSTVTRNIADADNSGSGSGGGIYNECGTLNNAIDGGNVNENYLVVIGGTDDNIVSICT